MNNYSDRERQEIAQREYDNFSYGNPIAINENTKVIGYISEIKNKLSGENTYIVTDVKLPDNPTKEDLRKVGHVTVLYQGSTTILGDWVPNNLFMTARIKAPDWIPTRPSIQLRDASHTLQETLQKYPNADISIYGHSLGSMNAQSAISDVEAKYDHRISGVYLYNGPNTYKTLSDKQRENVKRLHHKIFNYIDTNDFIGFGYDDDNAVGQVFKIKSEYIGKGLFDFGPQHNWGGYRYDNDGNLIHANGELVSPETRIQKIDINRDGVVDLIVGDIDTKPRNLLSSDNAIITGSQSIVVNSDILKTLSNNLLVRMQGDIEEMLKLTHVCIEKNNQVSVDFNNRKQKISETLKEVFKSSGIVSLLYDLHDSVDVIMNKKYLLEEGKHTPTLNYPFTSKQTPLINGNMYYHYRNVYERFIIRFQDACSELLSQVNKDKNDTYFGFLGGEPTLLNSWGIIEHATKQLLKESDELFEGEGLRTGKEDGISQSLKIVLEIIEKNTTEILQSLVNVVELIRGIADNFEQADNWLGERLKQGQMIGELQLQSVPKDYKTYLERDGIFDDVKDVMQAFDRQVEINSRQYARKVAQVYQGAFGQFEEGLKQWHKRGETLINRIKSIQQSYTQLIYVKEETVSVKQNGHHEVKEITYPQRYWGKMEELYSHHTRETIQQIQSTIVPKVVSIQQAIWKSGRVKGHLQHLEPQLKPIVEEGVYKAFDLEDIIKGQQAVLQLARHD